jgi:competence protein ComEA
MDSDTDPPSNRKEIFMKKSIYLMAVTGCILALVSGCGSRKEVVLLASAVTQEEASSGGETVGEGDSDGTADGSTSGEENAGAGTSVGTVDGSASGGEAAGVGDSVGMADGSTSGAETAFVFICGAVVNPGVYEVENGSRICDVLELAGGFGEDAETDYLNLAEPVSDGQKVYVPTQGETATALFAGEETETAEAVEEASGRVNINTASKEVLVTLPGIGESKADSILAYRAEHGGFSSIEEIMEIPGIKEAVFSKIKELITVD